MILKLTKDSVLVDIYSIEASTSFSEMMYVNFRCPTRSVHVGGTQMEV